MNSKITGILSNGAIAKLIRRAQRGDTDAFATLFEAHKVRVYSLCLRMTNNAAEAEDLTQDAFFQVFRKLHMFRGESALSTWLYRIAMNTVLMHFRRKSPCRVSLDDSYISMGSTKPVRREYGTRDGRLETSVTRIALARAISELPAGYRAIFLLHEVEGYQHREIAGLLRCSVGTSKSQLHKAKLRIRDILTQTSTSQTPAMQASPARFGAHESSSRQPLERWQRPATLPSSGNVESLPGFLSSAA